MAWQYLKKIIWFGKISSLDAIAHSLLINKLEETLITIPNPLDANSNIDLALGISKQNNIDVNIVNNTPFINCDIFISATIKTSGKNFDYTTNKNIELIELQTSKYLEKILLDYLYTLSKEYKADVLDFKNILSKSCMTNQELENYHWENIYKDSFFKVTVNTNINSTHLFDKE